MRRQIPAAPANRDLQLVIISARPDDLAVSLAGFGRHLGSRRALVAAPAAAHAAIRALKTGIDIALLDDEEILPGASRIADHATRNFALRRALYAHAAADPVFIAADDDSLMLRPLSGSHFFDRGKLVCRYSHASMAAWKCSPFEPPRSYDRSQWETAARLAARGMADFGFGAHQAQAIVKADFAEAMAAIAGGERAALDEWSAYFNYALHRWPDRYRALASTALFWPGRYGSWMPDWFDTGVWFENYYASNYEPGGPASEAGIARDADWRIKRDFCAAGYAAARMAHMLNELSCGAPLRLETGAQGLRLNASRMFGLPGVVLRICAEAERRANYVVRRRGRPLAECASPPQRIGARSDLCIRMPAAPGEYEVELSVGGSTIRLPLLVLPVPAVGLA